MLEQYRKEYPTEEKDLLPEGDAGTGKRKILFLITGTIFALLLFVYFMNTFKSEDDQYTDESSSEHFVKASQNGIDRDDSHTLVTGHDEPLTAARVHALEEKVVTLTAQVDRLERSLAGTFHAHSDEAPPMPQLGIGVPSINDADGSVFQAAEDGIAMTNQAMRDLIAKQTTPAPEPLVETPIAKKSASATKEVSRTTAHATTHAAQKTYTVKKGDTLSKIAQNCLGSSHRWRVIYNANRERIPNVNQLKVGTTLVIPEDKKEIAKK